MKLKTLKDIIGNEFIREGIKQEAIKWVKYWLRKEPQNDAINEFKHFHNITEDDLKSPEGEE